MKQPHTQSFMLVAVLRLHRAILHSNNTVEAVKVLCRWLRAFSSACFLMRGPSPSHEVNVRIAPFAESAMSAFSALAKASKAEDAGGLPILPLMAPGSYCNYCKLPPQNRK